MIRNRSRYNSRFGRNDGFFSGMPLFFKLWFGFVFTLVIGIFALTGYIGYNAWQLADDPAAIGNYVGEIVRGFNEASQ